MLSLFQFIFCYYRPQTKFAKVMFLHLSVSHSVHGGYLGRYTPQAGTHPMGRYTPLGRHTPRQVHPQAGTPPRQVPTHPGQVPTHPRQVPPEQCTLGAGEMEYILVEYWFPKKIQSRKVLCHQIIIEWRFLFDCKVVLLYDSSSHHVFFRSRS